MLRGMTTQVNYVDDVAAARDWYAGVLGIEAYFERKAGDRLAYIEFRVGDFQHELGFIDRQFAPEAKGSAVASDSPLTYWAVDDLEQTLARLLELGATPHTPVTERGEGFVTASVVDPFGNPLGIMENPYYREVLASLVEEQSRRPQLGHSGARTGSMHQRVNPKCRQRTSRSPVGIVPVRRATAWRRHSALSHPDDQSIADESPPSAEHRNTAARTVTARGHAVDGET